MYSNLINTNSPDKHPYMLKWEQECDITLSPENWSDCISKFLKCTRSIRIRETAIKLFTRWYYTPAKLHTIFPTIPHTCFRGCISTGSFTHIFWDCEKVSQIWKHLESFASIISTNNVILTPSNCLLFTPIIGLNSFHMRLVHTICVAIHWLIAYHWKSSSLPLSQLKTRINNILLMEKIFHTLNNSKHTFDKKWNPWFTHANQFITLD